jgi:lipoyl(octanoyl) transferase
MFNCKKLEVLILDIDIIIMKNKKYEEILNMQKKLHNEVKEGRKDILFLVEHKSVFTLGRKSDKTNILISDIEMKNRNIELFKTGRGGDVTYHGPGQITGYPIINLKNFKLGIKDYVNSIQDTFLLLLKEKYNIDAYKGEGRQTGVWVNGAKICAVGVEVKRYVTLHGFGLNINTDLDYFDLIIPCGLKNSKVVSIKSILNKEIDLDEAFINVIESFAKVFKIENYTVL